MGEEVAAADLTAPLGAVSWILKRKLLLGVVIGILLGPLLDRSTTLVLNRFFPLQDEMFGRMADEMPNVLIQGQRLEVLNELVQNRHILDGESGCPLMLTVVQALNRVPLLFAGEADVINNYNILTQDSSRSPVAFAAMLSSMAEALEIEAPVLARRGIDYRCQ